MAGEFSQAYLEFAAGIVLVLNDRGEVVFINQRGSETLGYKREEIIGKKWFDNFVPGRFRNKFVEVFEKRMSGVVDEEVRRYRYVKSPVLTKDGEEKFFNWESVPLLDKQGQAVGLLSIGLSMGLSGLGDLRTTEGPPRGHVMLILNDNPADAERIEKALRKTGLELSFKHVGTREDFERELKKPADLIIVDHDLPHFDGVFALSIAMREAPMTPVIFVSDQLDERLATELLKLGVEDCLSKTQLDKLPAVAIRALERANRMLYFLERRGEKTGVSEKRISRALRGPKKKPRDLVDIYADILRAASRGISKTRLVSKANLNFPRLEKYLDILVEEGLLEVEPGPSPTYSTSERGLKFLERYEELKSLTLQLPPPKARPCVKYT
jgi:PAS domain S-box-containing protein